MSDYDRLASKNASVLGLRHLDLVTGVLTTHRIVLRLIGLAMPLGGSGSLPWKASESAPAGKNELPPERFVGLS